MSKKFARSIIKELQPIRYKLEDFLSIAKNPKYGVYCLTSIGPVEVEEVEYRNGVSYMVKLKEK